MNVNIIIDKICNKKCKYCEHSYNLYQKRSDDLIYRDFDNAMNKLEELFGFGNFRPQLQGGEPTMLRDQLIDKICERLKGYKEVLIFSNGFNRSSRLYKEPTHKVITHITDWIDFNISEFDILPNETLAFCIPHDEIHLVKDLISTATGEEKVTLIPCWSDNPKWDCTKEDRLYLSELQKEYDGTYENNKKQQEGNKLCSSGGIPIVDCVEQMISPCGFIPDAIPLSKCNIEFLKNKPCLKIGRCLHF